MMSEGKRPHPGRSYGRRVYLQDAADDNAIGENVEIVVTKKHDAIAWDYSGASQSFYLRVSRERSMISSPPERWCSAD
jgi:hypothetical protein